MTWPSFGEYIQNKAHQYGQRPFIQDWRNPSCYSYKDFGVLTSKMAWGLRSLGVIPGDRVAILHPNHTDFILAYGAIVSAGAVAVPINPLYTAREVSYILADSGAKGLITTWAFKGMIEEIKDGLPALEIILLKEQGESLLHALERRCGRLRGEFVHQASPDDLAFIFYTSGTTGKPKGVMLTHRNIVFGGANTAQNYGLRESDVAIVCLPLVHIFANASPVLGTFNSGGKAVIMERFQTESVLDALQEENITWFSGVPTMFSYLLQAWEKGPRRISSLRMGLSGGASLSKEHMSRFQEIFGVDVLEVYGLTESTGLVTGNPIYGIRKVGSIGIQVSGVTVKLLNKKGEEVPQGEVGEIVFKGANGSPGYWNLPDLTRETIRDGWIFTRDLAWLDREGYYYIVGRKDELIICGGYNVYPREIEELLYQHESVAEVAVIGVEHPDLGYVPKAFVVPKPGLALTPEVIKEFCQAHLAPYKVPREVEIRSELPKSSTGKILKKLLSS